MALRRTKNVPLKNDGKVREYRLRRKDSPTDYVNYYRGSNGSGQVPTFNKHGKVWKSMTDIEEAVFDYEMRQLVYKRKFGGTDEEIAKLFPLIEIELGVLVVEEVMEPAPISHDLLERLDKFQDMLKNKTWSPVYRLAERQVMRGEPFRYLFITKGVVDRKITGIEHSARIGAFNRMKDDTVCVFAVRDNDTDLMYARVGLAENTQTIWDFKKLKIIYERT